MKESTAISDDEIPIEETMRIMKIVEENSPANYMAAMNLDWSQTAGKTVRDYIIITVIVSFIVTFSHQQNGKSPVKGKGAPDGSSKAVVNKRLQKFPQSLGKRMDAYVSDWVRAEDL